MKRFPIVAVLILTLAALALPAAEAGAAPRGPGFRVTITNLTQGQIFSPPILAVHSERADVFSAGEPASDELAALAEDGDRSLLAAALEADPEVLSVILADNPIPPGESASFDVFVLGRFRHLSAAGMLVTTNDAFFGLDSYTAPAPRSDVLMVPAYDAGTEVNSEDCGFIPGPPCGNGGVRDTVGAEGFVAIHSGIHGVGDLMPAESDWRNPVAKITIEPLFRSIDF